MIETFTPHPSDRFAQPPLADRPSPSSPNPRFIMCHSSSIQHHTSFTSRFPKAQDGISPNTATQIHQGLNNLGFRCLKVYCDDNGLIYYGIIDSDGTMVNYSYGVEGILTYLHWNDSP